MQEAEELGLDRLRALSILVAAKGREEAAVWPQGILTVEAGDAQPRARKGCVSRSVGACASLVSPAVDLQDGRGL
jgi:hypothetical protein